MKTVIMAGGRGTRISSVASDIPKPMIKIEGKPVLEHELECLRDQGFTDIILTVSHLGNIIMDYFGDGSGISPATGKPFGVHIEYYFEKEPLGNAGALFKIKNKLDSDFLLLNADAVFDVDFNRFVAFHKQHGGLVTLFTHPNSHPYDSGLIIADKNGAVDQWLAKEDDRPEYYRNRVNAGLHVINPIILEQSGIDADKVGTVGENGKPIKVDLDRQLLKPLAGTGKMFCYDSPEYVKDMGTPERYYSVCEDYKAGRVSGKNLKNKQRAVFLDRDGTINKYVGFLRNIDEFDLIDGVADAIKKINASGYLAIVITNQPVIARGEVSFEELEVIHNKMETLLGKEGAYLDGIYFCPHHPHKGYEGERPELKFDCDCRKPKPGMLMNAAHDFNIDLSQSWMIGDGEIDIKAGQNASCQTALIGTGDFGQTIAATSLKDFVEKYLKLEEKSKMRELENRLVQYIDLLVERYPSLESAKEDIIVAYLLMEECYENGGKLLVAGNGGSAADAEHIVGELMKGFKMPRKPDSVFSEKLVAENQELGLVLAENLQGTLPAIALDGHPALSTAYMNDCEPLLCFAQQVNGYGKAGDIFLGISTSGNSKNVLFAATTAHAKGMKVIGLTGAKDSKLKDMSDVCIKAPQTETYMIQELHLPIYHCLCLMLEDKFYGV